MKRITALVMVTLFLITAPAFGAVTTGRAPDNPAPEPVSNPADLGIWQIAMQGNPMDNPMYLLALLQRGDESMLVALAYGKTVFIARQHPTEGVIAFADLEFLVSGLPSGELMPWPPDAIELALETVRLHAGEEGEK